MLDYFFTALIPYEVVISVYEVDVLLVKDCCPLKWSPWE
jgi:hypothetical protein